MKFKVQISNEVNEKDWNKQLESNSISTAYQIANWPKIYQAYDSKPVYISIQNSTGEILGQLAGIIHSKLFWQDTNIFLSFFGEKLNLRTILNWFYGPIIFDVDNYTEIISLILSAIDKVAKENKITMVRGISPPLDKLNSKDIYQKHDYSIQHWSTYIINLKQKPEYLFDSFDKKTRYDIRKSEQTDLKFEVADSLDDFNSFHNLKIKLKKMKGQKVRSNSTFVKNHWELMYKKNYENLFLVKKNDKTIGGVTALKFNNNIIQHGVGSSKNDDPFSGSFVTWNSLKFLINEKSSTFDLGGINPSPKNKKEKQIDFFKSKWGGIKYEYLFYTKIFDNTKIKLSSLLKNPKRVYQKLSDR